MGVPSHGTVLVVVPPPDPPDPPAPPGPSPPEPATPPVAVSLAPQPRKSSAITLPTSFFTGYPVSEGWSFRRPMPGLRPLSLQIGRRRRGAYATPRGAKRRRIRALRCALARGAIV